MRKSSHHPGASAIVRAPFWCSGKDSGRMALFNLLIYLAEKPCRAWHALCTTAGIAMIRE
jgi:hypothetical protein